MLKKTIFTGALVAMVCSVPSFADRLTVTATNNAAYSTAIGGNAVHRTRASHSESRANRSPAVAGSIVMPSKFDCRCLKSLTLRNTSRYALAVGDAYAGSIVLEGHRY